MDAEFLVPFEDSNAIATAAIELLDNEVARHAMRKRAYMYARDTVWNKVAESYMSTFVRARSERIANNAYRVLEDRNQRRERKRC
jgi:glycosyltransferase involved in cell wall biosynthesis